MECAPEGGARAVEYVVGVDAGVVAVEYVVECDGGVEVVVEAVVVPGFEYWLLQLQIHCYICESFELKDA